MTTETYFATMVSRSTSETDLRRRLSAAGYRGDKAQISWHRPTHVTLNMNLADGRAVTVNETINVSFD